MSFRRIQEIILWIVGIQVEYTVGVCGRFGAELGDVVTGAGIAGNVGVFAGYSDWVASMTSLSQSETGLQEVSDASSGVGGWINLSIGFQVSTAVNCHDLGGSI